ncbi:MAG TPA: ribosomal RNA small subunit methyltransferase A [Candidatus Woesearchaeota archaeon]|nr:ribosomal RNA small subunit methyltransferase A [Candidatus Woesearchaeota archaeon]
MARRLGQHFLKKESMLNEIAGYLDAGPKDVVLEIGSAFGNLTKYLAKAKKVYAVELDKKLFSRLVQNMKNSPNVEPVNSDILKFDFPKDVNKIIGNIPYEISSPLTERILKFLNKQKINGVKKVMAVIMYQKEFADRMTAFPGLKDYSRLSILASYYSNVEMLKIVGRGEFRPSPKVDSAVVRITPLGVEGNQGLFKVAKAMFMHKNKKVVNSLIDSRSCLKIQDKQKLREILNPLLKEFDKKVFYLEIEELEEITDLLKKKKLI